MRKIEYFTLIGFLILLISCKSESPFSHSREMNKMLYKSSLNIIEINPKYRFSNLNVTNGELKKIDDTTYSILVDTSYYTKLVFKQKKKIREFNFRVVEMPQPELLFFSKERIDLNNLTAEEFKKINAMVATLANFPNDCIFKIISLEIIKINRIGTENKIELKNPNSDDIRQIARQSNKGDVYIFKNIKIEIQETKRIINGKEITIYLK